MSDATRGGAPAPDAGPEAGQRGLERRWARWQRETAAPAPPPVPLADDGGGQDGGETAPGHRPEAGAGPQPAPPGQAPAPPRQTVVAQLKTLVVSLSELGRRLDLTAQHLGAIIDTWALSFDALQDRAAAPAVAAAGAAIGEGGADPADPLAARATPGAATGAKPGSLLPQVDLNTIVKILQALEGIRQLLSQLGVGCGGTAGSRGEEGRA